MDVEEYIYTRLNEVQEFKEKVELEGSDIVKKVLNDEWLDKIIKDGKRVWRNEEEVYSGCFFPFRWLYEQNEWEFINTTFSKLYNSSPKKNILYNKFKDIAKDNWMANGCAAFEIECLCKFFIDNVLVEVEPKINKDYDKRGDALININTRDILVEISSFQQETQDYPRVGYISIDKNMYIIQKKIEYKDINQLQYSNIPTILIITVPPNIRCDQIQAKGAIEQYFSSTDNENISAIIVSDSYLFKYGAYYYNNNSKFPLTNSEKQYLSNCLKMNNNLKKIIKCND